MARTDYGAILSTVIKDTSDAVREVNGTSSLIAPNQWGTAIRTMHSDSDYENALEQMIEETATGDIASFSDGANDIPLKSLTCTINPVQDLHGQDYPYPSGGGKNKLGYTSGKTHTEHGITFVVDSDGNTKVTSSGASEGGSFFNYYTLKLPVGTYYLQAFVNGSIWAYASGGKFRLYVAYNGGGYNFGGTLEVTDASKDIVVYIQAMSGMTYNDTVQLMISEGSTAPTKWSPYSNICPITGHTELNLVHTGANLWDEEWENGTINSTTGEDEPNSNYIRSKNYIRIEENTGYFYVTSTALRLVYYDKNKSFVGIANANNAVVTSPANAYYVRFYPNSSSYGSVYKNDISINYPSTDTSYHAYTGTTTTTDLGTTVYGGTLDVVSGVLTTTHALVTLDGTTNWISDTASNFRYFDSEMTALNTTAWETNVRSNLFAKQGTFPYCQINGAKKIRVVFNINDTSVTTVAQLQALLTQTNLQAVYPLATPTTTQLTPQEVKSLLGSNNIYHDCNGQVAVVYRANGQLYVAQHS